MGKIQHDIDLSKHLIANGPKFCSHRIQLSADGQVALIKPTLGAMALSYFYLVLGSLLLLAAIAVHVSGNLDLGLFMGALGIAIATFGVTSIRPMLRPAKFDYRSQDFSNHNERLIELKNIRSLQINDKRVMAGGGANYLCYELNLLTVNGRRINILNHNDLPMMRHDAQVIADFLSVEYAEFLTETV